MRVGVLLSGSGTNLQAILDASASNRLGGATVALVISNRGDAKGLERARVAGVPTVCIDHQSAPSREVFEDALVANLTAAGVDLVVLAGFLRLLSQRFLRAFPDRVINIHPSLLPAFPGMRAQAQALSYGVKVTGCTVHFVDEGADTGPIIAQAIAPVLDGDDEAALTARILIEEHRLLPLAIRSIAEGRVVRDGRTVRVTDG